MTIPVTGSQHPIAAGEYTAVVTELGAGMRELKFRDRPVIAGHGPDELPPGAAGQLLAPWPNRVDGGRYRVAGTELQLDLSEPSRGNAIHGLTRWMPWAAIRHAPGEVVLRTSVLGRAGYPFCLELEASYQVDAVLGLRVGVTAQNVGSRPAPYGTGSHPYLAISGLIADGPAHAADIDECDLTLPCAQWLPIDDRGIPAGPPRDVVGGEFDFRGGRRIGATRLDHAFTGLSRDESGLAWARLSVHGAEVALWAGPGYEWLQVFTGDTLGDDRRRRALAIEPMTCPPNAFVTGADLIMLEPGAKVTHTWGIRALVRPPGR